MSRGALRRQEGVDDGEYEILVIGWDRYGLVRKHEAEDKRIRFLRSDRDINPAEARNRGINVEDYKVADCTLFGTDASNLRYIIKMGIGAQDITNVMIQHSSGMNGISDGNSVLIQERNCF